MLRKAVPHSRTGQSPRGVPLPAYWMEGFDGRPAEHVVAAILEVQRGEI
jgi:hypothetical protein